MSNKEDIIDEIVSAMIKEDSFVTQPSGRNIPDYALGYGVRSWDNTYYIEVSTALSQLVAEVADLKLQVETLKNMVNKDKTTKSTIKKNRVKK